MLRFSTCVCIAVYLFGSPIIIILITSEITLGTAPSIVKLVSTAIMIELVCGSRIATLVSTIMILAAFVIVLRAVNIIIKLPARDTEMVRFLE